jgi:hypothetical protein
MELEERIVRLERLNRMLVILLLLVCAGTILGPALTRHLPTAVLKAKQIQLVGETGEVLVSMTATANGNGTLTAQNNQGEVLVAMGSDPNGNGSISVYDGKGELYVRIGTNLNGNGEITAFNREGRVKNKWP